MAKKILVDAVYADETRVAITDNGRLEDFDYFTPNKKNISGGIYLAIVTRVEPSLQAAFIDYGGDKHGFLPFAEIHPDYYNIPIQDKQAILDEIAKENTKEETPSNSEAVGAEEFQDENTNNLDPQDEIIEESDDDQAEKIKQKYTAKYKIQEVIKRNQVILVQAIKEERGNKGAFFTSYISLAGRYCVIMPNSHSKGGISRKVTNPEERKKLRSVIEEVNSNNGISLIIRTIGKNRKKEEILNDYKYLSNLWNDIRDKTLSSIAPAFIHAEDDLIKRIIRDMYDDETDELVIQGKDFYNAAKNVSKAMIACDEVRIREYKERTPLFSRYKVDEQIANLYNEVVCLESGGYIVINHTEALIAVDVNSGKATSERNVEETAIKTNVEAAREICRQIKLRNLSGLLVIDFIDMMETRNKKTIERLMRDAFYNDRAKTHIGYISNFGLLEMSRQRLKPSFLEHNTAICTHCNGKGVSRSLEANSLMILRTVESEICKARVETVNIYAHPESTLFILNNKRKNIHDIESRYGVSLVFFQDATLSVDSFAIENVAPTTLPEKSPKSKAKQNRNKNEKREQSIAKDTPSEVETEDIDNDSSSEAEAPQVEHDSSSEQEFKPKKRRPRPKIRKKKPNSQEQENEQV